tara:strand:- start:3441 stop:3629 length:189 start_codon:yes stop_codon:yes gene_type:complete
MFGLQYVGNRRAAAPRTVKKPSTTTKNDSNGNKKFKVIKKSDDLSTPNPGPIGNGKLIVIKK